jgi:mRNA interferase YafQ
MSKTVIFTNRFVKERSLMISRGKDVNKLKEIAKLLENDAPLPLRLRDHKLSGNYKGSRELHIEPDWLLIYRNSESELILERTGTHSDLFDK